MRSAHCVKSASSAESTLVTAPNPDPGDLLGDGEIVDAIASFDTRPSAWLVSKCNLLAGLRRLVDIDGVADDGATEVVGTPDIPDLELLR